MRQPLKFGKYLLLERISVGGMAEVFKAKSFGVQGFEKILAIKRILPSMAEDQDFITMFIDEAKIAGQLQHVNICQIFELGKIADSHFIAMEFIWGKDLLQIQNRFRRMRLTMPPIMAAHVCAKVAEGLDFAHRKRDPMGVPMQIVHRDISPQNVILSYDGDVKVIDFGIAKAASRSSKTQAGVLKGKFGYMSPEQVRGLPLDRRSDIFAMGTILYELLCGERLFLGESDFSTLEKVRHADVAPLSRVNKDVPPSLERIVMKALARSPEDRYQWAAELGEDLSAFIRQYEAGYGNEKLGRWMKDAFASELARERQLLEQYKSLSPEGDGGAQHDDGGGQAMSLLRQQVSGKQQGRVTGKTPPPLAATQRPRVPTGQMPAARPPSAQRAATVPASPPSLPRAAAASPTAKRDAEWDLPGDDMPGEATQISDGPSFLDNMEQQAQPRAAARPRLEPALQLSGEFEDEATSIHGYGNGGGDASPMAASGAGAGTGSGSGAARRQPERIAALGALAAALPDRGAPLASEATYILSGNDVHTGSGGPAGIAAVAYGQAQGGGGHAGAGMVPQLPPGTPFSDAKTAILMDTRPPEAGPVMFQQPQHQQHHVAAGSQPGAPPGSPPMPALSASGLVYSPPVTFTPAQQMPASPHMQMPNLLSGYTPPPIGPLAAAALSMSQGPGVGLLEKKAAPKRSLGRDLGLALAACALALGLTFAVKKVAFAGKDVVAAPLGQIAVIARGGDAKLFLNQQELGLCKADVPMKISDVAVGKHELVLRWSDGRELHQAVELAANEAEVFEGVPPGAPSGSSPSASPSPSGLAVGADGQSPSPSASPSEADRLAAEAHAREVAAAQAAADAEAKAKADAEALAAAEVEAKAKADAQKKALAAGDKEAADRAKAEAKAKADEVARLRAEAKLAAKAQSDEEAKAKAEARAAAKADSAAKAEAAAAAKAEAKAAAKAKAEADAKAKDDAKAKAAADKLSVDAQTADPSKVGYLIANTEPWARVVIDGKDTGMMTPIAPRSKIPLKPGKHTVTFVIDGQKFKFGIVIVAGEDYRLIKTLEITAP